MTELASIVSDSARNARFNLLAVLCAVALAACGQGEPESAGSAGAGAGDSVGQAADQAAGKPGGKSAGQPAEMDHSAMDHAAMGHEHEMTEAQFAELREKIPLYAVLTNEQIMANMNRMPADWWEVLSPAGVEGRVGVLALGHGYSMGGNEQFKQKVAPIADDYPTAVAPGMAMMSASHIQKAVDALTEDFGVNTIVVVPMEPGDDTSLIHQWQYIFGLREEAPYLSVPRVETDAEIVFTKSPAADPLVARIMRDHGLEAATNPADARLILVSHGPEKVEDNPAELELLETHAERIRESSEFQDVKVLSLQDDAVPEVRAANKARLREMISEASEQGREVVIVPMILTRGGFHARLQKDLEGLDYQFANRGLIEHPEFQDWISSTVTKAAG